MSKSSNWQSDWNAFVVSVVRDIENGMSCEQVSAKYADANVEWIGTVRRVEEEKPHAVVFSMPVVKTTMRDGRVGHTDHLAALVNPDEISGWKDVTPGMVVRFETSIREKNAIFPGLEWSDVGSRDGYLSIGTNPVSRLIAILRQPIEFEVVGRGYRDTSELPKGDDLHYRCNQCGDVFPSIPDRNIACECGNIIIDWDMCRMFVEDYKDIDVVRPAQK